MPQYPPIWDDWSSTSVKMNLKADIKPSEDPELVLKSVQTLFPSFNLKIESNSVIGNSSDPKSLDHLCQRIMEQRILDATRRVAMGGATTESIDENPVLTVLCFNKQVALVDKVAIAEPEDSPLGVIELSIITEKLKDFIDVAFPKYEWLVPKKMQE